MRYADGVPPGGNGSENYSDEDDGEDYGDEQDDETFEPPESTQKSPDLAEEEENEDVVGATSADDEIASLHGNDGGGGGDETEVKEHKTDTFVDLQVAVLCNQAASFLKVGDGPAALEAAERASTLKAPAVGCVAGIKAAYRRACALEAVADWDAARDAFTELLALDPKNVQCSQVRDHAIPKSLWGYTERLLRARKCRTLRQGTMCAVPTHLRVGFCLLYCTCAFL